MLVQKGKYIYFLIFFPSTQGDNWIMGRPFLQKYQFIINPDKKFIFFYSNLNPKSEEDYSRTIILIIVIIGSIIIILIIGYMIWKCNYSLNNFRKKRANELDDEYEYKEKKDLNINEGLAPSDE